MRKTLSIRAVGFSVAMFLLVGVASAFAGEDWLQFKFDCRNSGNVAGRDVTVPLGLVGAVPLTDAVLTAPVLADGRIYAVDASGVAFSIDAKTLEVLWKSPTGASDVNTNTNTNTNNNTNTNCNNVSSPAVVGKYLHFGTTAGSYYVLDRTSGKVIKRIDCKEPIFSAPVVSGDRVYFATLGSRVHALQPDGTVCWIWDFVTEVLQFNGDRWDGRQWLERAEGRVTWRDSFCCSMNVAALGKTVVVPAGGRTIWLEDTGSTGRLRAEGLIPNYAGSEYPATFGQSIGTDGSVYRQWHRRDNAGRVEILKLDGDEVQTDFVPGTQTAINLPGLLSFCSVSLRGEDVFRCRPEAGYGFVKHAPGLGEPLCLGGYPSIASPILLDKHGVHGGLDGSLYVVPLSAEGPEGKSWSFKTAFGAPISAPVCVADGRIYFGCEDGYLYVLGPDGTASLPSKDLEIRKIRDPMVGPKASAEYDWFTNYGNFQNTNSNDQGVEPPFAIKWIRRYEGTFKHLPVCGGGRMYTHTSEGQIFAVEQQTGRLLWRRYWPHVHLSFTAPLYHDERLLLPQAGLKQSRLRCLDAATGKLLWDAPFSGSPSWSRQAPPTAYKNLAIYTFGSGKYATQGSAKPFVHKGEPVEAADGAEVMSFIYTHDNPYYPKDNRPLIRAWDLDTGQVAWSRDFSEFGSGGNDSGACLMGETLYYSTFFGYAPKRKGQPSARGLTAALDPASGRVLWTTTDYSVMAGCTISGKDGRLYVGGYNRPHEKTDDRYIFCLDARDGSLIWRSDPVASAVNVVTIGEKYIFSNASGKDGHVLDKATGKILSRFNFRYACTRFTHSEPYVLGANMDMIDLAEGNRLITSGPAVDSRECVGSVISNGRLFYTSQASGLQVSKIWGQEAAAMKSIRD